LLDIYWNILTMHGPINVKSPNNISKWQMGFDSAFKGLKTYILIFFSLSLWRRMVEDDRFICEVMESYLLHKPFIPNITVIATK
jgi:hypothetical protein